MPGAEVDLESRKKARIELAVEPSTKGQYASHVKNFERFCGVRGLTPFPLNVHTVELFMTALLESDRSGSVSNAWSALVYEQRIRDFPTFGKSADIRALERVAKKDMANRAKQLKDSLPIRALQRYCTQPKHDRQFLMTKALLPLGIRGLFRPGELISLTMDMCKFRDGYLVVDLGVRKNRLARAALIFIDRSGSPTCPVANLERWLRYRVSECGEAPKNLVFCKEGGAKLTYLSISDMLADVAAADPAACAGLYLTSHCIRVTGATAAMMAGFSDLEIQIMGDWKSNAFLRYLRNIGPAAKSATLRMGL